jgi:hypothetical protein
MIAFLTIIPFFIFNLWSTYLSTLFFAGSGVFSFILGFYVDSFNEILLKFIEKIG